MDYVKERLKEKCLLFLYVLSENKKNININTFRRYIYLYYLSGRFLMSRWMKLLYLLTKAI